MLFTFQEGWCNLLQGWGPVFLKETSREFGVNYPIYFGERDIKHGSINFFLLLITHPYQTETPRRFQVSKIANGRKELEKIEQS